MARFRAPPYPSLTRSCRLNVRTPRASSCHEAAIRSRNDPVDGAAQGSEPWPGTRRPLGLARGRASRTRSQIRRAESLAPRGGGGVRRHFTRATVERDGCLVSRRPPAIPGGCSLGMGACAPSRHRRPADRERQDPAGHRRDPPNRVERALSGADTRPAGPVGARDRRRVRGRHRALWGRRPPSGSPDGSHLRERIPAHGPARRPIRPRHRRFITSAPASATKRSK